MENFCYPKDKVVCSWSDEELDLAEIEVLKLCIEQFNRNGKFTPHYECIETRYLRKKLNEYEDKYKVQKKAKKKKNFYKQSE